MSLRGMNAVNDEAISEIAQFIPSDLTEIASLTLAMTSEGPQSQ